MEDMEHLTTRWHVQRIRNQGGHERFEVSQSCQDTTTRCYLAWMDLEWSDLFERHMQSGHGKVYTDSFTLFISIPLASLCALILNNWRFSDFHLQKTNQHLNKTKNICLKEKNIRALKKKTIKHINK